LKGFVQVYTGNGKGKTTAALGLALRAAGAGYKVFIAQFVKGMRYSELNALERFSDLITLKRYGRDCFICRQPEAEDVRLAKQGLAEVKILIATNTYALVILDEANIGTYYDLFSVDELLDVIDKKHETVELVITGRYADPRILAKADLVTEMREVKHYFAEGVDARKGIES
jgi:cob(I)alamin adenosyltransferase